MMSQCREIGHGSRQSPLIREASDDGPGGTRLATTIRLLDLADADGAWNMAVDEALLDGVAAGGSPLALRFYGWSRPCVSLGCGQSAADLDVEACVVADLSVVRRASGGTAVVHESALGFSLAIPPASPLAVPDIVESYRLLGEPVHRALLALGVDGRLVQPSEAHRGGRPTGLGASACFASLAPYEVTCRGRKIVGTSQIRRRGAILHHVMLPLTFDAARLAGLLAVRSDDERRELAAHLDARIGSVEWATELAGRRTARPVDRPSGVGLSSAPHIPSSGGVRRAPTSADRSPRSDSDDETGSATSCPPLPGNRVEQARALPGPMSDPGDGPGDAATLALRDSLVGALREAFATAFDATLERGSLAADEVAAAERLVATKYASDGWTHRR